MQIRREFAFRISFLEIYNETIRDLISNDERNLKIHESLTRGVYIGNLVEEPFNEAREALEIIEKGFHHRHVGETNLNDHSSRSHGLVRVVTCSWTATIMYSLCLLGDREP